MTDRQTFIDAYDAYADGLFRYCALRVYDREVARDLMQTAFMRVWNQLAQGKTIDHLKAFLYKVARNLIIDHVKRHKSALSLDALMEKGFDLGPDLSSAMKRQLDAREALKVLEQLKPKYRDVLILRYIQDLSVKEVARVLSIRENATSVRINRALKMLRNLIPPHHDL